MTIEVTLSVPEGVDVRDIETAIEDAVEDIGCSMLDFNEM